MSRFSLPRHGEHQYLDLLRELLDAPPRATRNDTATRSVFGRQMRFDLARGFPLLTTKKVFWRGVVAELLWFLSGSTNVRPLQEQGVAIWDEWADETGELGPVYGKQWRQYAGRQEDCPADMWNDHTGPIPENFNYSVDQIRGVLHSLRTDPHGRRHIVSAWNPTQIHQMALPPCHCLFQFYVGADERLSCQLYQRSADVFLGVPFNIASYALLTMMFAQVLGRQPGEFIHTFGDLHLYSNHEAQARQQILREPRPFPTLETSTHEAGSPPIDMDSWTTNDFKLRDYDPWPGLPAEVSR